MKIIIHGQDYTSTLDAVCPLTIKRALNQPSVCEFTVSLPLSGEYACPERMQMVSVTGDNGVLYFTGYVAVSLIPEYAGMGLEGPRYRYSIQALSDDILLNQFLVANCKGIAGASASVLLASLVSRTGSSAISTQALTLATNVGRYTPSAGAAWSKSAGQIASQARASYRAINGALSLQSIASTVHTLDESNSGLALSNLKFSTGVKRSLANDVVVCGEHEPVAYVTEYFRGDGVTTQFYLSTVPYMPSSSKTAIISEQFNEASIDRRVWGTLGASGYFSLGGGGLSLNGGTGIDGQVILEWLDPVEMGGALLLEATGLRLSKGSTGVLSGFYQGSETMGACTAGFRVSSAEGDGSVSLQPIVQGNLAGSSYAIDSTKSYTLRIRIHASESHRAQSIYRSYGDNGQIVTGGEWSLSSAQVLMDVQEYVDGVGGMPVTLYEGSLNSLPGVCTVVAASSQSLVGSMRSIALSDLGPAWVVSTSVEGSATVRRIGTTAQAGECRLERAGTLVFYTGYVPASGERISVSYRTVGRAVGRAINSESQAALAAAGYPSVATWIGSVSSPETRTSADCRNAAEAIVEAAASVSSAWQGTYKGTQLDFATDVWPGDALELVASSLNMDVQVVVRSVTLSYGSSVPDLIEYAVTFANDWADDLAIQTTETVPDDTWLPVVASPTVLDSPSDLTVTSLDSNSVTIHVGLTAPDGGGFEIRRRDFSFTAGEDSTLVMRSSAPNITFARESSNDKFYIRMYDGATPPNYSEFSAALFINLPLS